VAFAQAAIDMPTLERKVEDAQAAFDRNRGTADRQEISDIRDELEYLRVKQRRGAAVTRSLPFCTRMSAFGSRYSQKPSGVGNPACIHLLSGFKMSAKSP
jgi:hypothetical protein